MKDELLSFFPGLDETQLSRFASLPDLYRDWNAKINVISRKDTEHLYVHHILHSLSVARFISFTAGTSVIDIGTGGGFHGIPLAIFFPRCDFLLVDSIGKKITVVSSVAEALGLKNVQALKSRAEDLDRETDFVVSRAVAPMTEIMDWTSHLIRPGGNNTLKNGWIFLKGGNLDAETNSVKQEVLSVEIGTYFPHEYFEGKRILYTEKRRK